jgi:hypothetical protein
MKEIVMRIAFFVAAALMSTVSTADEEASVQRAKALGAYIDSYTGTAGLLATECQDLNEELLKTPHMLLDEERPFLSDSEYQEFKADLESEEYKQQIGVVMVGTLKSAVVAGMKAGSSHRSACRSVVDAMMDHQIKPQKAAWDAMKRGR